MSDLKYIFEALVPENIKDVQLIQDAMNIFLENLEKNAAVAFDIKNIYNNYLNIPEDDLTLPGKENLRSALLNIYLQTMYNVIKNAQGDKVLQKKLELSGIDGAVTLNKAAEKILGTEFFVTNKTFKESVGTLSGINYSHAVARTLESNKDTTNPTINEIKPFHMLVEGPLTSEIYDVVVKPLSHPVGFTYGYRQVVELALLDYFGLSKTYDVNSIEIRGSKGSFEIFTPLIGQAALDAAWVDFQQRQIDDPSAFPQVITQSDIALYHPPISPITPQEAAVADAPTLVTVFPGKVVSDIIENITSFGRDIGIMFTDDTYIIQTPGSGVAPNILYVSYITWLYSGQNSVDGVIRNFTPSSNRGHYSIATDYTFDLNFTYYDTITNWTIGFTATQVDDATGEPFAGTPPMTTYLDSTDTPQPIGTSDHWVMTSTNFVQDDFIGYSTSAGGNYMVSEDLGGLAYHIISEEGIPIPNGPVFPGSPADYDVFLLDGDGLKYVWNPAPTLAWVQNPDAGNDFYLTFTP